MGNLCSYISRCWEKITDRYYHIEEVKETDLLQAALVCVYPFCYTINSISIDSNRTYYRFRGRYYCCRNCVNSHKKIGYSSINYEAAQYADL